MVWTRIVPGVALVAAVLAALVKSGDAVVAGHWAYLMWLLAATVLGSVLIGRAMRGPVPRRGTWRAVGRWVLAVLGLALAGLTFWLAPYRVDVPDRTLLEHPPEVTVSSDSASIWLEPTCVSPAGTGVAFIPGALVDPRAYIPVLSPLAQAGHQVVITKPPLGIAFLAPDAVGRASATFPDVDRWVVAGHSLGGAVGSTQAIADDASGLILLGSYPIGDLSSADLPVLSVSGSNDGLTTPADVAAGRSQLPAGSTFVVIEGGTHAFFGDYGEQGGDGVAEISREQAQKETVTAMLEFLTAL